MNYTNAVRWFTRITSVAILLSFSDTMLADVTSAPALTDKTLVGAWEALIQKEAMPAAGIYQMAFSKNGDAYLVAYSTREDFTARLASRELTRGHIKLRFTVIRNSTLDWVQVEGGDYGEDNSGQIMGKITLHDGFTNSQEVQPVLFIKGLWIQYLLEISKKAEEIIRHEQSK